MQPVSPQQTLGLHGGEALVHRVDRETGVFPEGAGESPGPPGARTHFAAQAEGDADDESLDFPVSGNRQDALYVGLQIGAHQVARGKSQGLCGVADRQTDPALSQVKCQ